MQVRLISKTEGAKGTEYYGKSIDEIIVGQARVSSSRETNELFAEPEKLLRHCLANGHWSIFSLANLGFEIITSRAMGRELLRHWSIRPTEFSQRYAEATNFEPIVLRMQGINNRQGSSEPYQGDYAEKYDEVLHDIKIAYESALNIGISRETARGILPECTTTVLNMNGGVREWITLLNVRLHKTAQEEMRELAAAIRDVFIEECPIIASALFNFEDAYHVHILERVVLERWGVYDMIKQNNFKRLVA